MATTTSIPASLTVPEAARALGGLTIGHVYKLIAGGAVAATKVDGVWRIDAESVAAYKERRDAHKPRQIDTAYRTPVDNLLERARAL